MYCLISEKYLEFVDAINVSFHNSLRVKIFCSCWPSNCDHFKQSIFMLQFYVQRLISFLVDSFSWPLQRALKINHLGSWISLPLTCLEQDGSCFYMRLSWNNGNCCVWKFPSLWVSRNIFFSSVGRLSWKEHTGFSFPLVQCYSMCFSRKLTFIQSVFK